MPDVEVVWDGMDPLPLLSPLENISEVGMVVPGSCTLLTVLGGRGYAVTSAALHWRCNSRARYHTSISSKIKKTQAQPTHFPGRAQDKQHNPAEAITNN